jgi:hypothetical protein
LLTVLIPAGALGSSTTNAVKNRSPKTCGKPVNVTLPVAIRGCRAAREAGQQRRQSPDRELEQRIDDTTARRVRFTGWPRAGLN